MVGSVSRQPPQDLDPFAQQRRGAIYIRPGEQNVTERRQAPPQGDAARREPPLDLDGLSQQRLSTREIRTIDPRRRLVEQFLGTAQIRGTCDLAGGQDFAIADHLALGSVLRRRDSRSAKKR